MGSYCPLVLIPRKKKKNEEWTYKVRSSCTMSAKAEAAEDGQNKENINDSRRLIVQQTAPLEVINNDSYYREIVLLYNKPFMNQAGSDKMANHPTILTSRLVNNAYIL